MQSSSLRHVQDGCTHSTVRNAAMTVLRTLGALGIFDAEGGPNSCVSQSFSSPALRSQDAKPASLVVTFGAPLGQRNGGIPVLGGAIAIVHGPLAGETKSWSSNWCEQG